ncbi:hypothetical protein SD37_23050 [Amycolatopsis orientalis]|uniref:Uncharacterized protein n=1 Tax=Amycolatopsis orientalis TaxID=31958 RepID=A0A193C1F8_AMYOR|nr:hypothetical protein SD37_23050 [Amycolatopsis orientalis]
MTPLLRRRILKALETRWIGLAALIPSERTKLGEEYSHRHAAFRDRQLETAPKGIAFLTPLKRLKPRPSEQV